MKTTLNVNFLTNILPLYLGFYMMEIFNNRYSRDRIIGYFRSKWPSFPYFFSIRSLWLTTGKEVYDLSDLISFAAKRQFGVEKIERIKTSKSYYLVFLATGLLLLVIDWIVPELVSFTFTATQVQAIWSVLASLISVSFIVIIFLLQYIENEYHNQRVVQDFIGRTFISPTIYFSFLSISIVGAIYLFSSSPDNPTSPYFSVSTFVLSFLTLIGIGIVYYRILNRIFSNPLDQEFEEILFESAEKQIKSEIHREIAQHRINTISVEETSLNLRSGGEASHSIESFDRKSNQIFTDQLDANRALTLEAKGDSRKIDRVSIDNRSGFITDIHLKKLSANISPIRRYEDHISLNIEQNTDRDTNYELAYIGRMPEEGVEPPELESAIKISDRGLWEYKTEEDFESFQEVIAESIEDGNLSQALDYRDTITELVTDTAEIRNNLISEYRDDTVHHNDIGGNFAENIRETSTLFYLKMSETKDVEETYKIHEQISNLYTVALEEQYPDLATEVIKGLEDYCGSHRHEIHDQKITPMLKDITEMLRKTGIFYKMNEPNNEWIEESWIQIIETCFYLINCSPSWDIESKPFVSFWQELHEASHIPHSTPTFNNPGQMTPLIWFLSIGHLYHLWNQNYVSTEKFTDILGHTIAKKDHGFNDIAKLYKQGTEYQSRIQNRLDLQGVIQNVNTTELHNNYDKSIDELLKSSFVIFMSYWVGSSADAASSLRDVSPLTQDNLMDLKEYAATTDLDVTVSETRLDESELISFIEVQLPPELDPDSTEKPSSKQQNRSSKDSSPRPYYRRSASRKNE